MTEAPGRFLLLYALAWAGASIAYVPFLTVLLPVRVEAMAGSAGIGWLAWLSFVGALAASAGHLLFGWLSDVTGTRRPWIAAGLLLSCLLLASVATATSLSMLLALIIAWQLALNMMMAPLAALAGDVVPDSQKGLLGGLLAFAPGLGALSGSLVTWPGLASGDARLLLVAGLVLACVGPLLLLRLPAVAVPAPTDVPVAPPDEAVATVRRMWLARLAVQIAEATLFAYLYFWFVTVDARMTDNRVASLFAAVLVASAPLALFAGRWADRRGRPFVPLVLAALGASAGLALMATAGGLGPAIAGFALFALTSASFLALHSAQTLRVLVRADRRGRDIGLFNLTNTIPSLIMPWLTLGMVPRFGFSGLFVALALLCLLGALILGGLARER